MAKALDTQVGMVIAKLSGLVSGAVGAPVSDELCLAIGKEIGFLSGKRGPSGGTSTTDKGKEFLG